MVNAIFSSLVINFYVVTKTGEKTYLFLLELYLLYKQKNSSHIYLMSIIFIAIGIQWKQEQCNDEETDDPVEKALHMVQEEEENDDHPSKEKNSLKGQEKSAKTAFFAFFKYARKIGYDMLFNIITLK